MKIYLAGPMRGLPLYNFPAFESHAAALRASGHEVFSPAERDIALGFDPSRSIEEQGFDLTMAWRWNLEAILACEAIALMPGHEQSQGATLERLNAEALGLQVLRL